MSPTAPKKEENAPSQKNPTALVAGGAGFIGSHLCDTLVSQNFHVVCVDNLSNGKKENVKDILTSPNFTFIEGDINDPNFALPAELKIDYCFHLATTEEYQNQVNMSLDTLLVNSLGTRQLLEIAKTNKAKFILVSSADLYSGAISSSSLRYYFGKTPQGEAILSVHEAKRFAEALSFEYFKKFNLDVTVLRLKDVYGPKMDLDRGDEVAAVLKSAVRKEAIKIHGDGLKTLNPTYVSDVVFGIIKATMGQYSGEIFILVNPEKVTVENFAQTVKLVAGPLEIEHSKEVVGLDIPVPHLDLDNTKEKISWRPKVTLAEGISSVVQVERVGESKSEGVTAAVENSAIPVLPTTKEKIGQKKVSKRGQLKLTKWVRLSIFLLSLALIILTIVYPIVAVATQSYLGSKELKASEDYLQKNSNQQALDHAYLAQNSLSAAEKNLANINWLLKIVGFADKAANLDHLLLAADNLSESIRATARANQILIDTASKANLSKATAEKSLKDAFYELNSSKEKLVEITGYVDTIDWKSLPTAIAPEKDFMYQTIASLQKEADTLIDAINKALGKNAL